jgi:hypothetical protein
MLLSSMLDLKLYCLRSSIMRIASLKAAGGTNGL